MEIFTKFPSLLFHSLEHFEVRKQSDVGLVSNSYIKRISDVIKMKKKMISIKGFTTSMQTIFTAMLNVSQTIDLDR